MEEEQEGFKLLNAQSSQCFCPGEGVVYQCAINGSGFTRYTARAENGDCLGDSLFFSHTDFDENNPVTAECDAIGVPIIAQGFRNNSDVYISIVNVTALLPQSGNLMVQCYHFNGTYNRQIGTTQTPTATGM